MSKSNHLELAMLDHVFGGPDFVRSATVHLALTLTVPTDADTGATLDEPAAASYERFAITNNAAEFPAAAGQPSEKTNANSWLFPVATENWDAGAEEPLVGWALCDAAVAGNVLYHGEFPANRQRAVLEGDQAFVGAGSLTITED